MPALDNPKHERFAQELAKGRTQIEAYTEAGYKPDDGAAARLSGNVRVKARLTELQERAAIRCEVTVADLTVELQSILTMAKAGETAGHLNAARQSVMDIAKLNGLVVEKQEHTGADGGPIKTEAAVDLTRLTEDQLRALASIKLPADA